VDVALPDALLGRLLDGRYQVGQRLARGGMATVHEGLDTRLGRSVALKIMHPDLAEDREFVDRFIAEARLAARLSRHPNVVAVYDQGETGGLVWIAMELVDGRTLRSYLRERGPLPVAEALDVVAPVLSALSAAHLAGMIHRDVKPENVLVGRDGRVQVTDFGLARAVTSPSTVTRGVLLGTVAYISPEQALGLPASPASDVYSAGIVLSELLTGHAPHQGPTDYVVVRKHVDEDVPPPSVEVPGLPPAVDDLVRGATARDPDERLPDAPAFLAALLRARSLVDAPVPRRARATAEVESLDQAGVALALAGLDDQDGEPDASDTSVLARVPVAAGAVAAGGPVAGAGPGAAPARDGGAGGGRDDDTGPLDAGTQPGRPPARRGRRRGALVLVAVLLVAVLAAWGGWWYTAGRFTTTPALAGLSVDEAATKASALGLAVEVSGSDYSETVAKDEVLATDPAQGDRVRTGGTVDLILSLGPERYDVPDLVGSTQADATAALQDANLVAGEVTQTWHDKAAAGVVVEQGTEPGTSVRPGTAVDVVVSKGREPVELADWTGKPAADAVAALKKSGLRPKTVEAFSDEVPAGRVVAQQPAAGEVYKKDPVTLTVSRGPELVTVPRVEGQPAEQARRALAAAGLDHRTVVLLPAGPGNVLRQSPSEGSRARQGTTITLYVF
jgi:serine/threonine-protein kinase